MHKSACNSANNRFKFHRKATRRLVKIWRNYLTLVRFLLWLFFSPHPQRRLANARMLFNAEGLRACYLRAIESFSDISRVYQHDRNRLTPFQCRYILSQEHRKPVISILVVIQINTSVRLIKKCIKSVCRQHYENWELVLLGEYNKKNKRVCNFVKAVSRKDKRIHLYDTSPMTVGARLNEGLRFAAGEFIGFLGSRDELSPDALTWLVWAFNNYPDTHWFYSDEDKISAIIGRHHTPNFKPDFSTELLLSNMYTDNFCVYSASILSQAGGFSETMEIESYYDLALRLAETLSSESITHIPRVLYHRRDYRFFSNNNDCDDFNQQIVCNAISLSLKRRNLKGQVSPHPKGRKLCRIDLEPILFPKVSIIIPSRNNPELLQKCLTALRKHTRYPDYEVIIIDNQSDDPLFYELIDREQLRVIKYDKPFNHSDMNNIAIDFVQTDWVVLMNNDVEILSEGWLEQMVATAQMDGSIAVVGGLLLYPSGGVQHGGILLGIRGVAGHAHKYMDAEDTGYFGRLHALQEYSGLTAALSLIRKSAFVQVGGFNSIRYPTSFNDVDLCIRFKQRGFRCIYNPRICAIHYELKTRPVTENELVFRQKLIEDYDYILNNDRFYNPNLSLSNEQFRGFRVFPVESQIPILADIPKKC